LGRPKSINVTVEMSFRLWFGESLVDHDLTVTALSHSLNVFDGEIEDWLAGRSLPAAPQCVLLAELFETSPSVVLRLAGYTVID